MRQAGGLPARRRAFLLALGASALLLSPFWAAAQDPQTEVYGSGANRFSLATGSPGELGLLKALAEAFAAREGATMTWYKAGTGQSLKLLRERKVDLVMVHAPGEEERAVREGWAAGRTLIGSNEFYLVGPGSDPAGIAQSGSAADAYRRIAGAQAKFVSRGDNSGTHQKEMRIWRDAGIEPQGAWYIVTKDFMIASLKRADAEGTYFMTDSSTWATVKRDMRNLKVLFRGDKLLVNTYHAMTVAPGATAGEPTARRFVDFVASEAGQTIIRGFGAEQHGEPLYNDASYAKRYVP